MSDDLVGLPSKPTAGRRVAPSSNIPPLRSRIGGKLVRTLFTVGVVLMAGLLAATMVRFVDDVGLLVAVSVWQIILALLFIRMADRRVRASFAEPTLITGVMWLLLFGIRPLWDLTSRNLRWTWVDTSETYPLAVIATALMTSAYAGGYLLVRKHGPIATDRQHLVPASRADVVALRRVSNVIFSIGLVATAVAVESAGGIEAFLGLRESRGSTGLITAARSLMALTGVAALARLAAGLYALGIPGKRGRSDLLVAAGFAVPLVVLSLGEGSRREVLPILLGAFVLWSVARGIRPPVLIVLAAGAAVILFVLLPFEDVRPGGTHEGGTFPEAVIAAVSDPAGQVDKLLSTQSTQIMSALAMGIGDLDSIQPFPGFGLYTAVETVLQPIPQQLWPEKPEGIRNTLISLRFGLSTSGCTSLCPTYGPVLTFYADFGLPGVAAGGLILGMLVAGWVRMLVRWGDVHGHAALAATWWGVGAFWWGSLSGMTLTLLFSGVPFVVSHLLSRQSKSRRRVTGIGG